MRITPPKDFAREIEVATALVRQASAAILRHYHTDFAVSFKDHAGKDPVTQADHDANQLIVLGLRDAFPDDAILAEESDDSIHSEERLRARRLWCVDPLDGTREFVDKNGQFVVMVGLAIDGEATLGVVLQPTEQFLMWGVPGLAVGVDQHGTEQRLAVSTARDPQKAVLMVSRSHRSAEDREAATRMGVAQERPLGSVGLKIAQLATATADAYFSTTDRTKEWDACAPEAIIKASGGRMTDICGAPLVYNKKTPNTPRGLLASNGPLHEAALAALRPFAKQRGFTV
jgi:3'(2'), 5'-bisphosphate nucleotidase